LFALVLALFSPSKIFAQATETPFPVEPGHFLLKMDALSLGFERDRSVDNKYSAVGVATTIVSAGLTRTIDVQVGFQLFLRETYQYHGARDSNSGLGDVSFRAKWMFWRDTEAGTAAAVIPYVKVPTNSGGVGNHAVEGGVIVPWQMDVAGGIKAGAMGQWDLRRNDANDGYDSRWYATGYAQRNLTGAIGVYAETTLSLTSASFSDWEGTLGAGATLNASKNIQWDYSLNRGLNRRATDWTHVLRLRWGF
jgi:hypothetical protein